MFPRNAEPLLRQLLNQFPVVAIIGPRQCGKTTLAKKTAINWQYFDLENSDHFIRIKNDPNFFFEQYPEKTIIDEAQLYPELFTTLRGVIDAHRNQKGRYILTGSSSPELQTNLSESLAGRVAVIELSAIKANERYRKPLSPFYNLFKHHLNAACLDELKQYQPINSLDMQQHWFSGGYPEPIMETDIFKYQRWMQEYRDAYINRDIKKLFPKINEYAYQRFLTMLATLSATILNRSEIARALEVSESAARDYLKICEGTFLWRQLPSYEKSTIKSIVKLPKGHLRDTGLLHFLLKIDSLESLYQHPIVGRSFESFVIEEILKGLASTEVTNVDYYYYRTRTGLEVDFILEGYFGLLPIEIKYGQKIQPKQLKNLTRFITQHNAPFGVIINQAHEITWLTRQILQLPVGYI